MSGRFSLLQMQHARDSGAIFAAAVKRRRTCRRTPPYPWKALLQLVLRIRASHWYKGVPQSPRLRFSRSDAG
jgi:hypothetical protein